MWWDIRKFTTPVEKLVLDPRLKEEDGSTENVTLMNEYFNFQNIIFLFYFFRLKVQHVWSMNQQFQLNLWLEQNR